MDIPNIKTTTEEVPRPLDQVVSLIYDALHGLGHRTCPYCEMFIGLEKFITEEDIRRWLMEGGKA